MRDALTPWRYLTHTIRAVQRHTDAQTCLYAAYVSVYTHSSRTGRDKQSSPKGWKCCTEAFLRHKRTQTSCTIIFKLWSLCLKLFYLPSGKDSLQCFLFLAERMEADGMKTNTHAHTQIHPHTQTHPHTQIHRNTHKWQIQPFCDHSVNAVMSVMYPQLLNAEGKWSQIGVWMPLLSKLYILGQYKVMMTRFLIIYERNPTLFRLEAGFPTLGFTIKVFKMLNDP